MPELVLELDVVVVPLPCAADVDVDVDVADVDGIALGFSALRLSLFALSAALRAGGLTKPEL